ncbi:TIGR03557 family F420-dependent LLM class oxidoreductase [Actinocorallia sp. A-T 12471]|uniref:TIGR03557 family F420-dependent LLM class oxidoreductase n=1 Tax=Actinocorallia sp. A-T 12471 TaxID=3089813 RepID=UPI0029CAEBC8|nr:TIGR03557 family F420-dependent LLM class oxidoreductase [Actinocorallia sp. A-T 12471]MDX6739181.1 TIGR03557 family F420-dependent LLM class oxidoreductase [Actinocorallia sp. A-T 12471]
MEIGYKLMAEAYGPIDLVEQAVRAEEAGFDFVEISDHFHPWLEAQGHSPFAWSVLGAIAARTERIRLLTGVTCPTVRYHPAIIAQAAATLGVMSRGRFTLGVGSGERLNEHVVGEGFPESPKKRQEMLREAVEIIRLLWQGGYRSYRGEHFELARAKLFDLPDEPVPIAVAAGGPAAAKLAAEIGDALFVTEPESALSGTYREAGGRGPVYGEMSLAYAQNEQTAVKAAHSTTRWSVLGWKVMSELPTPSAFAAASETVREEDIAAAFPCGSDPDKIVAAARSYVDSGTDHLVILNCGPDPDFFFDFYSGQLDGRLRALPKQP